MDRRLDRWYKSTVSVGHRTRKPKEIKAVGKCEQKDLYRFYDARICSNQDQEVEIV